MPSTVIEDSAQNGAYIKKEKVKKSAKAKGKEPVQDNDGVAEKSEKKQKKDRKRTHEELDENSQDAKSADELRKEKKRLKKEKKARRLEAELTRAEHSEVLPEQQISNELNESSLEKSNKSEREEGGDDASLKGVEKKKKEKKEKKEKKKKDDDIVMKLEDDGAESSNPKDVASEADIAAYLQKHSITIDFGSGSQASGSSDLKPIISFSQILPRIPSGLHNTFATFKEPTPIQACTWPPLLAGRDVVGIAETGSGKTLAFGVPAVSKLVGSMGVEGTFKPSKKSKGKKSSESGVQILAVAPTRELAIQTHDTFSDLGKPFGLTSVAVFGGVDKGPQRAALRESSAAMVVGTPGRILDLIDEGVLDLSAVTFLVLDEADRMLDRGFENDIRKIIDHTAPSEQRQTLMFSATWPEAVRRLAGSFQRNPVRVTVGSDDLTANSRVEQVVEVFDDVRDKDSRLLKHMRNIKKNTLSDEEGRTLVFVLYKREAPRVEQLLSRQGWKVAGLHGDLSQSARMAALDDFKTGKTQVLVATDVAARGLDIADVGTVINYTFPLTIEDYIHRIGRTGRGGKSGKSITFFTGDNHERALAGEYARVLREGGFDASALKKFPMTIKKKEHSVYGAFYRDDAPINTAPTHMKF